MARTHFSKDSFCHGPISFESLWHNAEPFLSRAPRHFGLFYVTLCLVLSLPSRAADRVTDATSVRQRVKNFSLADHEGKMRELYRQSEARAVVLIFTTTGCPIVQKSVPKIKALRDEFAAKGVIFWLINSTAQDDPASIRDEAREFAIDLPILLDRSQAVARSLKATRTAEAFCIDPRSRTLFYRGAIDNQFGYGSERKKIDHAYLQNALNHFLSGKKIDPARTEVSGCRIQLD